MSVLSNALRQHLPHFAEFSEPKGGYFVWLKLPDRIDTQELLSSAQSRSVNYQPGLKFSHRQGLKNYMRLSFSYYEANELEKGARVLSDVLRNKLA